MGKINLALIFIIAIIIALNLGIADASFKRNSYEIQKSYRAGETIKGNVNLNLTNENANSLFVSNFVGNITLIELIKKSGLVEGEDYKCSSAGCKEEYEIGNIASEIEINGEKSVGLKIEGKGISKIEFFGFSVKSNLNSSCEIPLKIDILADGVNIVAPTSYTLNSCGENNYGCFDKGLESGSYSEGIINEEVCETIELKAAPAYTVGARIKNESKNNVTIIMRNEENDLGKCTLPQPNGMQEVSCIIKYSSPDARNVSVCARGDFRIRSESKGETCGSVDSDFEIFARAMEYGVPSVNINNSLFESLDYDSLEDYIFNYLKENYGTDGIVNCEPCLVPIKFKGPGQKIVFENVKARYSRGSIAYEQDKLYEINTKPSTIDANNIILELDKANFRIPISSKDKIFSLFLGDKLVFKEGNISIEESFDFALEPKFAFFGINTKFNVITNFNITSTRWDFGDRSIEEVKGKSAIHRYNEMKTFTLEVEVIRNDKKSAVKTFEIIVGNPKESAEKTISKYKSRLTNLSRDIDKFPDWIKDSIKKSFDVNSLNNSLKDIEVEFKNASSDEEYAEVMNKLLELEVPNSVSATKRGKLPMAIGFENIDPDYYFELLKEKISESERIKELIIGWYNGRYTGDVEFERISALKESSEKSILTRFKFSIAPKEKKEDGYFIIDYPFESITFMKEYGQKQASEGSGAYIPVKPESQDIEFLIEGEAEVAELGAYLAPARKLAIVDIELCEEDDPECNKPFPLGRLFFWLGAVFVVVFIVYLILQEWYKGHYEHHLFKDSRDLYNLINFIYNSRSSGLKDEEIKKKLKEAGWKGERITYAFRKIDGKRTGMWEIPVFRAFERKKVMKEIAKRQGGVVDARFIKQPRF